MSANNDFNTNIHRKSSGRGRGRGRGRPPGRPKKSKKKSIEVKQELNDENEINRTNDEDMRGYEECLESELTSHAISFVSPVSKPLHQNEPLDWNHRVNLMGEKVLNPRIHVCEQCQLPILVYGRMIHCKHVFCLSCAQKSDTSCPRCHEKVLRVEKSGLGTVHMCLQKECKRTYLSQRDLEAHIHHRHVRRQTANISSTTSANNSSHNSSAISSVTNVVSQASTSAPISTRPVSYSNNAYQSPIPVVSNRSNLITVPIQDEVTTGLNQMNQNMNSQTMLVTGAQPSPYSHHNQHINPYLPSHIPNTNNYYRPPPWPPMPHPYNNPYNRPYYPQ